MSEWQPIETAPTLRAVNFYIKSIHSDNYGRIAYEICKDADGEYLGSGSPNKKYGEYASHWCEIIKRPEESCVSDKDDIELLKMALSSCWYLLPDGNYGTMGIEIKKVIDKFNCWPDSSKKIFGSWVDIESAPDKPGSVAIIYAPSDINETGTVGEAFLADDFQWYWSGCDAQYHDPIVDCNSAPTHWMPLPEPPK